MVRPDMKGAGMPNLNELALQVDALEPIDNGYVFQRRARILQSLWRIEQGFPIHVETYGKRRGVCIECVFAKQSLANFLTDEIRQVVREEVLGPKSKGKLYGKPRIFNNLLSSQPLAFNLFAMLSRNRKLATQVFAAMSNGRCQEITRMEFEHSPGRRDPEYLGDRSAFDVYAEYMGSKGPGFVGIEVKYHENLNTRDRKKEKSLPNPRCDKVADDAGCFVADKRAQLKESPCQQIWRDHLLAESILQKDKDRFRDGFFVFLSPKDNDACNAALADYRGCLSCCDSFVHWTMEQVVETISRCSKDPWIASFQTRYMDFAKVDRLLI
jgi:hypothetical protein